MLSAIMARFVRVNGLQQTGPRKAWQCTHEDLNAALGETGKLRSTRTRLTHKGRGCEQGNAARLMSMRLAGLLQWQAPFPKQAPTGCHYSKE
jgi:hypothetical protein